MAEQSELIDYNTLIGGGYDNVFSTDKRYVVIKGSRGSKKSCTVSLWIIIYLITHPESNALVIRRYAYTNRNSTKAQLVWAIDKLGLRRYWKIPRGEFTLTYLPTGQEILFRGLDDAQSITSITANFGYLNIVWFEEAFQIESEDSFNKVDMSIRGDLPQGMIKRIFLTLNPWSNRHWIKARFFDNPDKDTLAVTTTYRCNEWLGEDDVKLFEEMKLRNPRRYRIEGDGEWGIAEGLIYENWEIQEFSISEKFVEWEKLGYTNARYGQHMSKRFVRCCGLDFGYTNDPTAFIAAWADKEKYELWIYAEWYEYHATNQMIADWLIRNGYKEKRIIADSAEPRTIDEIKRLGVFGIVGATKRSGVIGGIQALQDYKFIISPKCVHFLESIQNYCWKRDKISDKPYNEPEHEFSHLCVSGDTRIMTLFGKRKIKNLVRKIGYAFSFDTESGKVELRKFKNATMTARQAEIYEVVLSDGQKIKITGNHKLLTSRGWIECKDLINTDCIVCAKSVFRGICEWIQKRLKKFLLLME